MVFNFDSFITDIKKKLGLDFKFKDETQTFDYDSRQRGAFTFDQPIVQARTTPQFFEERPKREIVEPVTGGLTTPAIIPEGRPLVETIGETLFKGVIGIPQTIAETYFAGPIKIVEGMQQGKNPVQAYMDAWNEQREEERQQEEAVKFAIKEARSKGASKFEQMEIAILSPQVQFMGQLMIGFMGGMEILPSWMDPMDEVLAGQVDELYEMFREHNKEYPGIAGFDDMEELLKTVKDKGYIPRWLKEQIEFLAKQPGRLDAPLKILSPNIVKHTLNDLAGKMRMENNISLADKIADMDIPPVSSIDDLQNIINSKLTPEEQIAIRAQMENRIGQLKRMAQKPQDWPGLFSEPTSGGEIVLKALDEVTRSGKASPEVIKNLAKNEQIIKNAIATNIKAIQTKVIPLGDLPKPVPQALKPLAQEAKRHKSVEEFIASIPSEEILAKPTSPESKALSVFKGDTTPERLATFYNQVTAPTITGGPTVERLELVPAPRVVTVKEYTLLKQKIQAEARIRRETIAETKKAIKKLQEEFADMVSVLPLQERGKLLRTIKNIQTVKQLEQKITEFEPKIQAIQEAERLSKVLGTKRSKIAFLRKIGEFNQTAINEIKREIGFRGSFLKATEDQLDRFTTRLMDRLRFKKEKGFRPRIKKRETKKPEIPEDMYATNRDIVAVKSSAASKIVSDAKEGIGELGEELLTPISTRLKKIDISLKRKLRKFEFDLKQRIMKDRIITLNLLKDIKQIPKEDWIDLDLALKNGDTKKINEILTKHNLLKRYQESRAMLDAIHRRAEAVGFDVGYLKDYWPRMIKDTAGFLEYFGKSEYWSILDQAIQRKELDLGRYLTTDEKAYLINTMIRGYGRGTITLSKTGSMKERVIDFINPELNQFYHDSYTALAKYVVQVNEAIEARKFFGKHRIVDRKIDEFNNLQDSIGAYTLDLLSKKQITPLQEKELRNILSARFGVRGTGKAVGIYRNLAYIDTMGSPYNAVTQIGDFAFSMFAGGYGRAIKTLPSAITSKSKIKKEDLGIEHIAEEFTDENKLGKALDQIFRMVGLTKIDTIGKETLINAVVKRYQDEAQAPTKKFMRSIKEVFGDETDEVIADLKSGEITENVKYLAFNELLDYQPVALSELPEKYLTGGNGKIFYMLKTYTLKLFDVYRNKVFDIMKEDRLEGIKQLVRLVMALVIMNATADEIKNLMLGRKTDLKDRTVDAIAKSIGFSRYTAEQIGKEGLGQTLLSEIVPPSKTIDDISKDIKTIFNDFDESIKVNKLRTLGDIPVVGKLYYWWFGKGADYKETGERKTGESRSEYLRRRRIEGRGKGKESRSEYLKRKRKERR